MKAKSCYHLDSGYFCAAIIIDEDKNRVIEVAPILHYMKGWTRNKVREYVERKKWTIVNAHHMFEDDMYGKNS